MLQCGAVRCSVVQCIAVRYSVVQCIAAWCSVLQRVAVCDSVTACCSVDIMHTSEIVDIAVDSLNPTEKS